MAGSMQASDAEQLSHAAVEQKTLLTHNRVDFENLAREYFQSDKTNFGIIAVRRPPPQVARRLLVILNTTSR